MSPELATALRAAARLLERRDASVAELRRHLESNDLDEQAVGEALDWLQGNGYLDDRLVAERATEKALNRRGWGRLRVEAKLQEMQVAPEAKSAALADLDEETECTLATLALTKRFKGEVEATKAARFLAGRGFTEEAIRRALGATQPGWDE